MRTRNRSALVVVAVMLLPFSFPVSTIAYAQTPARQNRPAGVPEDYVTTPFGYYHPSCVEHLAKGDSLLADGRYLQHADGTLKYVPECGYPHYTARGEEIALGEKIKPPEIQHSWIVSESTTTGTSYGELSATWTVPPAPTYYDSQKIIFFPGLEDTSNTAWILQPVLNWNNDFTEAWSVASWNADTSSAYESSPIAVYSGDTILGTVKSTCSAGTLSCASWNVTTTDQSLGKSTTLSNTTSHGLTFNWAFGGVLEVYSVASCYDYPATQSQSQTFNNVTLYDDNFHVISNPAWSTSLWNPSGSPQCNYNGQASGTQVTLDYGTAGGAPWSFSTGIPYGNRCYYPGTYSFSLGQTPNSNSLLWQSSVTTNQTQTISLNWTLFDNNGTLTQDSYGSGYTGKRNYTLTRAPVGTPTLSINASVLQTETGCDAEFQENLSGTN